jgi:hypothetical protein
MAAIIPPSPVDAPFGSYNWADWFNKVRTAINNATNLAWAQITDFTGSNLNQIATRLHASLQSVNGSADQYHVSSAQAGSLNSGLTVVITTAKLTGVGANGSMTFTNGILTAQTQAT